MDKNISWKQKIKYQQILVFILAVIVYNVYNYTMWDYKDYKWTISSIDAIQMKYQSKNNILQNKKTELNNLKDIYKNKKEFINAYNLCYNQYKNRIYNIWTWSTSISFRECIYKKFKKSYILKTKDVDLEKIWISFWVYKDNSKKMSFDQTRFLASLDQNIFNWQLKQQVPILSFWEPTLINKKLKLYKESFTFSVKENYSEFINILKLLQNKIFLTNTLYYTIDSVSSFNIMDKDKQNINIQWSFYFTK